MLLLLFIVWLCFDRPSGYLVLMTGNFYRLTMTHNSFLTANDLNDERMRVFYLTRARSCTYSAAIDVRMRSLLMAGFRFLDEENDENLAPLSTSRPLFRVVTVFSNTMYIPL